MAIAIRGSQGFISNPSKGTVTVTWPAGTTAGDWCVAELDECKPSPPGSGWQTVGNGNVYAKLITAADVTAGSFQVKTALYGLVVFSGAGGVGRAGYGNGVKLNTGSALMSLGWSDPYDSVSVMGSPSGQIGSIVEDYTHTWSSMCVRLGLAAGYQQSTASPPNAFSLEVLAAAAPPAPLLSAPEAGAQVNVASSVPLAWLHQGSGTQDAYRVSIRAVGAGSWSYLDSSGAIQPTLQTVTSSSQSATVTSALTAGQAYEWQVATSEPSLSFSAYSATRQFTPVAAPTVNTVTPSVPANRLTGTLSWTATAGAGALVAWQAAITPSSATDVTSPMWTSPVTAGSGTTTGIPVLDWTNGSTYKAWVRVQQSGGLWSAWTSNTFTITWTAPTAPSSVAGQDTAPMTCLVSGVGAGLNVEAQWTIDSVTWTTLGTQETPGSSATFYNPLAPYGVPVTYRARTLTVVDGVGLGSTWVSSSASSSTDRGSYFVDDDRDDWLAVSVAVDDAVGVVQGIQVTYGFGADGPRRDMGEVQGTRGSMILSVDTLAARASLRDWLTTKEVWWHRPHPEETDSGVTDTPTVRLCAASPPQIARLAQVAIVKRRIKFDWVERP